MCDPFHPKPSNPHHIGKLLLSSKKPFITTSEGRGCENKKTNVVGGGGGGGRLTNGREY